MAAWQQAVVDEHPAEFVRGLLYPRWQFTNHSREIQRWYGHALDLLEVPWRQSSWTTMSVTTRPGVARLDSLVGPKA